MQKQSVDNDNELTQDKQVSKIYNLRSKGLSKAEIKRITKYDTKLIDETVETYDKYITGDNYKDTYTLKEE